MTVTITAKVRDALYGEVVVRLTGIDAIYRVLQGGDYEKAQQLALEYSDLLIFVSTDLGWGESSHVHPIELTTPLEVLRRAVGRLQAAAASQLEFDQSRTQAAQRRTKR